MNYRIFVFLTIFLMVSFSFLTVSCSDKDKDDNIDPLDTLPQGTLLELSRFEDLQGTMTKGMVLVDDILYVCDLRHLSLIDVSDPFHPALLSTFPEFEYGGYITGLDRKDSFLVVYIIDNSRGKCCIIDVSDPANPVEVGMLALAGYGKNVDILGNYAYLAALTRGVYVVDISNPTAPSLAKIFPIIGGVTGTVDVFVEDGTLLASIQDQSCVCVYDISDPLTEVFQTVFYSRGYPTTAIMSRGHIFLANGVLLPPSNSGRFCIFDMETSSLPVFQDTLDGASCQAVYIESHYAYVGFVDQFRVYDITDADDPTLEKTADFESDPINKINNVIVVDGFVYLTRRNELIIYKHVQ